MSAGSKEDDGVDDVDDVNGIKTTDNRTYHDWLFEDTVRFRFHIERCSSSSCPDILSSCHTFWVLLVGSDHLYRAGRFQVPFRECRRHTPRCHQVVGVRRHPERRCSAFNCGNQQADHNHGP